MLYRNHLSKFLSIIAVLIIALLYALPNLYPDRPILIVSPERSLENSAISATLDKAQIQHQWSDQNTLIFTNVDDQMHARDHLIQKEMSHEHFTLNLVKQTPKWLQAVGANAMKLGLDLQGGIHFLLEVDTKQLEKNQEDNIRGQISGILKDSRIRYTSIQDASESTQVTFLNEQEASAAYDLLAKRMPQFKRTLSGKSLTLSSDQSLDSQAVKYAVDQTIQSLEKRINELGISEATIMRQGTNHISIDLPGVQDIVHAKKIIGKTATLKFHMVSKNDSGNSIHRIDETGNTLPLNPFAVLSGDSIAFAHARVNDTKPLVEIRLDGNAHDFYHATGTHVGERMAVVYSEYKPGQSEPNEKIISAPVIRQALGDNFVIEGVGSIEDAQDLALLLRSGALAAPVNFIEETTIGPSLGSDNIFNGVVSLLVGSGVIFIFMAYYYRTLGMIANVALVMNVVMIVAILSILGATLTLPGIAGIVLSVGMAVDANVLINERIREEIHAGRAIKVAIDSGYNKAISAIIDANMTTLLVTFILFGLGSGAVKGFAVTTCMGIIASIFTSVHFTRALTNVMVESGWMTEINMSHDWFHNIPTIDFMKISKSAFKFSALLLTCCLLIIPMKGMNLGLDFTGGQQIAIETPNDVNADQIRGVIANLGISQSQVTTYGASNIFLIKLGDTGMKTSVITDKLKSSIPQSKILQAEFIGPQVGSNMLSSSLSAVIVALGITMLYVALRFEYRFAISAIVSLIHDPILILGVFALFQIEFNLIALAAMLTILGYSINDTIVVYDRVRETFKQDNISKPQEIINQAINQTLSRTVLTSCLTLTVVMALYLFGGDYLHGFSLSLAIGIVIGTYSSIYIAGSMAVLLGLTREDLISEKQAGELV